MSERGDDHGLGNSGVAGEALPECGEHQGTCARCGVEITMAPPKRRRHTGEAKRKRVNVTIKVPADAENGAGLWDDQQEEIKQALVTEGLYSPTDRIPAYEAWMAATRDWLDRRKVKA